MVLTQWESEVELYHRQYRLDSAIAVLRERLDGAPCGKGWQGTKPGCKRTKSKTKVSTQLQSEQSKSNKTSQIKNERTANKAQSTSIKQTKKSAKLPEGVKVLDLKDFKNYEFKIEGHTFSMTFSKRKPSQVIFSTDKNFELNTAIPAQTKRKAAIKLAKIFHHDASQKPDGYRYECSAYTGDDYGDRRTEAYMSMGFSPPVRGSTGGKQFGIVKDGKVIPDHKKHQKASSNQGSLRGGKMSELGDLLNISSRKN